MSTNNIVDLAARRAERPARAPATPPPPASSNPEAHEFGALLREIQASGHSTIATMIPPEETIAGLRDIIEAAHDAGWTLTTIAPNDHGPGIVLGLEVAVRVLPGGAS